MRPLNPKHPPALLRAYLAGLFDGEGCIHVAVSRSGPRPVREKGPRFQYVEALVGMTDEATIRLLHKWYRGRFSIRHDRRSSRWKPMYRWGVVSNMAANFLRDVKPYLRYKRQAADAALKILAVRAKTTAGTLVIDLRRVKQLRAAGHSLRSIAKRIHVSESALWYRLNRGQGGDPTTVRKKQRLINALLALQGRTPLHFVGDSLYVLPVIAPASPRRPRDTPAGRTTGPASAPRRSTP